MNYKLPVIAVAAFAVGYAVSRIIAPTSPAELASVLEAKLAKDPVRYEQVIDQTREFAHLMKADAGLGPTKPGYVPFKDLRLVLQEGQDNVSTTLLNKRTGEQQAVQYMDGRTAVGTYEGRLKSVKYETVQKGKKLAIEARKATEEKAEGVWDRFYSWMANSGGSPKKTGEIEQKIKEQIVSPESSNEANPEQLTGSSLDLIERFEQGYSEQKGLAERARRAAVDYETFLHDVNWYLSKTPIRYIQESFLGRINEAIYNKMQKLIGGVDTSGPEYKENWDAVLVKKREFLDDIRNLERRLNHAIELKDPEAPKLMEDYVNLVESQGDFLDLVEEKGIINLTDEDFEIGQPEDNQQNVRNNQNKGKEN